MEKGVLSKNRVRWWNCQVCQQRLEIVGEIPLGEVTSERKQSQFESVAPSINVSSASKLGKPHGMEESYVVLSDSSNKNPMEHGNLDARVNALSKAMEIATQHTLVSHPLCVDCSYTVQKELNSEVKELEEEIAAYEACLEKWAADEKSEGYGGDFQRIKMEAEAEEKRLLAELASVEDERRRVNEEMQLLEKHEGQVHDLETKFWYDWNDFKLQLRVHQEERDAVIAKIEVSTAQLEALKKANVLNDAFRISADGDFGTINGLRMGRLPSIPIAWEEINAAWGQACLLLFTMGQTCGLTFTYRVFPMGSFPRMGDKKTSYVLHGPVNLFWSAHYDKAMVLFLACLKELAEFAYSKDRSAGISPAKCFQLPYKIEHDKVNSLTIKQSFTRDERWTAALRFLLLDLKAAQTWVVSGNPSAVKGKQ